jgi:hypothetical protein
VEFRAPRGETLPITQPINLIININIPGI